MLRSLQARLDRRREHKLTTAQQAALLHMRDRIRLLDPCPTPDCEAIRDEYIAICEGKEVRPDVAN